MPAPKTIADLHRHPYPPIIDLKALAREEKKFKQQEYLEGQRALSGRLGWA